MVAARPATELLRRCAPFFMTFKGHELTIGLDLGDRWSCYSVLDEAGKVLLEQKLPTTPEAMKQTLERVPRSLMALETGTHSLWVSRLLFTIDRS